MEGARANLSESTEWQVPRYPRLSAAAVRFANQLNQQGSNTLTFTAGGYSYTLYADTAMRSSEFLAVVRCNINGHGMQLGLDAGLCALLFADWLPLEDLARLPEDLKKAVIIAALNPLTDFCAQHSVSNFVVEDIEYHTVQPSEASLFFSLSSAHEVVVGQAYVDTDEQTIATIHKTWQAIAKPALCKNTAQLPVYIEVIVGGVVVTVNEFSKLRVDDIILLDTGFSDLTEVYARISDNISFLSVVDGNKLTIKKQGGVVMASNEQSPTDQEIENKEIEGQQSDTLDTHQISLPNEGVFDAFDEPEPPENEGYSDAPSDDDLPGDENSFSDPHPAEVPSPESDHQQQPQTDAELNETGDLPVELLFVVDQIKITMKEIEKIKPGYVFELNRKSVGRTEIRANGILIGTGELVQIDERAGVRIIKLHGQTKADE